MAESYLAMPSNWLHGTLEPNKTSGLIIAVGSGGTPKTTLDEYWDGDIPWLSPKEITRAEGIYVNVTKRNITKLGLSKSSAKLCPPGTVMLSKRAPVGAVAVNTIPMSINQGFLSFTCGDNLRPLYLAYWLKVNKPYLDAIANGSTYPELYKNDLFEILISVPPIEEQDLILSVISTLQFSMLSGRGIEQSLTDISQLTDVRKETLEIEKTIKDLMYLLFSGELNIYDVKSEAVNNAV